MKKIGIFGGTFDPPHLGHLILASEAQHQLGLEQVLWVLTPIPPHKPDQQFTPLSDRLAMLRHTIADQPGFQLSTVDIDRPPPLYADDTVEIIRSGHPGDFLVFLLGGDSLKDLHTWHQPQRLLSLLDQVGVMRRPGDVVDMAAVAGRLPGIEAKIGWVNAPLLEISSSSIRQRVATGGHFRFFLPPAVYTYILEHNLYRA